MSTKKFKKINNVIDIPSSIEEDIAVKYKIIDKKCNSCGNLRSFKFYNNSYLCKSCFYMDKRGIARVPN